MGEIDNASGRSLKGRRTAAMRGQRVTFRRIQESFRKVCASSGAS